MMHVADSMAMGMRSAKSCPSELKKSMSLVPSPCDIATFLTRESSWNMRLFSRSSQGLRSARVFSSQCEMIGYRLCLISMGEMLTGVYC